MTACATCGKPIENEAFSGILCQSCFAEEERKTEASRGGILSKIPAALLVSLVPFFVHFRTSSSSSHTVNGEVVEQTSHTIDYIAVALGPIAIILGIMAILAARKGPAETRTRSMVLAVIGILFGALQILRGVS